MRGSGEMLSWSRYSIRFYKNGVWKTVIIDDYLPVDENNNLIFAACKNGILF